MAVEPSAGNEGNVQTSSAAGESEPDEYAVVGVETPETVQYVPAPFKDSSHRRTSQTSKTVAPAQGMRSFWLNLAEVLPHNVQMLYEIYVGEFYRYFIKDGQFERLTPQGQPEAITLDELRSRMITGEIDRECKVRELGLLPNDKRGSWRAIDVGLRFDRFAIHVLFDPVKSHIKAVMTAVTLAVPFLIPVAFFLKLASSSTGFWDALWRVPIGMLLLTALFMTIGLAVVYFTGFFYRWHDSRRKEDVDLLDLAYNSIFCSLCMPAYLALIFPGLCYGLMLGPIIGLVRKPSLPKLPVREPPPPAQPYSTQQGEAPVSDDGHEQKIVPAWRKLLFGWLFTR